MNVARAISTDLPGIERLLTHASLPRDGVADHIHHWVVARDGDTIVGSAALELYGRDALLRSVAVAAPYQGMGLGHELVTHALQLARQQRIQHVFLLTETAAAFFPRFGFVPTTRAQVPAAVHQSVEFTFACPTSATVMVATLD